MKKSAIPLAAAVPLLLLAPAAASAHVKWFTDLPAEKIPVDEILSPWFMALAIAAAAILALLTQLLPALSRSGASQAIDRQLDRLRPWTGWILQYGTAAALLIQAFSGTVFAPEFETVHTYERVLLWAAAALLLIPHRYAAKAGALCMLALFAIVLGRAGLFHMLDYGFYLAIIGVLLLERTRESRLGFPLLYLGTGLSLCWVAVEKWVFPNMALDIIENHGVPTFGFDAALFVVMTGFIEFVVGYLLVVGILNRLLAFVLTLIFISTTMLFGMTELIGHFTIHVVLLLFIIEGVSFYKPPVAMHKTRFDQMVFVSLNFIFVLATFLLIYHRFA